MDSLPGRGSILEAALLDLQNTLASIRLPTQLPGATEAAAARDALVQQIQDYLLPRLRAMGAPLLAVIGGSTGAGKSTLLNSLIGSVVSPAGVLRPTTREPVLVCNPAEVAWFADDRVFPHWQRRMEADLGQETPDRRAEDERERSPGSVATMRILTAEAVPTGLALVDAPDIDSVVLRNRQLADELLASADLWIFVTTAARYSDAIPWGLLRGARDRRAALAIVLDRVPPTALEEVRSDLSEMLTREGLGEAPLFSIVDTPLTGDRLPRTATDPLQRWLSVLSADAEARGRLIRRTLEGALDSLDDRTNTILRQIQAHENAAQRLEVDVDRAYRRGASELAEAIERGTVLRTEVLTRWQELVGGDQLLKALERGLGSVRDRLTAMLRGRPRADRQITEALQGALTTLVIDSADRAAERAVQSWDADPVGEVLLEGHSRSLSGSSPGFRTEVEAQVESWQAHVRKLVRDQGTSKRGQARAVSYGLNAVGLALMIVVFAHTGGLTGAEVAIAGGTATVSQKLLEALFGEQTVRNLAEDARSDLLARVDRLFLVEANRFKELLAELRHSVDQSHRLTSALQAVHHAR